MDKNSYHVNDRPPNSLSASYTQHTMYPSSFASNMGYFSPQPSKLQLLLTEMTPTPEIAFAELERTLIDIMNECSKHNIEMGKAWMLKYCTYPHHFEAVMEYLIALSRSKVIFYERLHLIYLVNDILFHGERKSISYIKPAIFPHLIPLLRFAYHLPNQGSTDGQRDKVLKVISIWAEKQFFDKAAIEQIREAVLVPPPPEGPRPPLLSNSMSPQHSFMRMLPPQQQQYHMVSQYHPPFPLPSAMSPPPFRSSQDQPPPPGMQILPPLQPPPPGLSALSPPHVPQYTSSTPPPSFQLPPNPVSSFTASSTIAVQEKSYYELPAGLMVTVTSPSVPIYTPFRKSLIRIPSGGRPAPSQELLDAVEQFYAGLPPIPAESIEGDEEMRDIKSDGWEEGFLDAFYEQAKTEREKCNKEREEKVKEERERRVRERDWRARVRSYSRERSRSKSFSRSRSRSRGRRSNDKRRDERGRDNGNKRYRSRSYSLSRSRSHGRSRSRSISRTRSRSRSRSRSRGYTNYHHSRAHNPRRRSDSRSRSYRRSRSRSAHRGGHHRRRRSYTPSFTSASRSRSRSRSPPRRRRSRTPSRSPGYQHGGLGLGPSSFSSIVPPNATSIKTFLSAENVGHQMLKKLGWSGEGTGLGTTEREGIAEPIAADGSRSGTGEMKFLGVGAGGMADDMFDQYRRGKSYTYNKELVRPRGEREEERCYRCGKPGHIARDCHDPARPFLK